MMDQEIIKIMLETLRQYLQGGYIQQARSMVEDLQELIGKPDVP